MKCLSREDVQLLVDKELDTQLEKQMLLHTEECECCGDLFRQAQKDKALLGAFFQSFDKEILNKEIPEFPFATSMKRRKMPVILRAVACVTAILGIASVVLFWQKGQSDALSASGKSSQAEQRGFPVEDLDPNQQWHRQQMNVPVMLLDANGTIIHRYESEH